MEPPERKAGGQLGLNRATWVSFPHNADKHTRRGRYPIKPSEIRQEVLQVQSTSAKDLDLSAFAEIFVSGPHPTSLLKIRQTRLGLSSKEQSVVKAQRQTTAGH